MGLPLGQFHQHLVLREGDDLLTPMPGAFCGQADETAGFQLFDMGGQRSIGEMESGGEEREIHFPLG